MAKRISVSFRDNEQELYEWVERQYEEGDYRSRSAVVIHALTMMRRGDLESMQKNEWKS